MATVVLAQLRKPLRLPEVVATTVVAGLAVLYVRPMIAAKAKGKDTPAESFKETLKRVQTTFNWMCAQRALKDILTIRLSLPSLRYHLSHAFRLDLFERMMPEPALEYIASHVVKEKWLALFDEPTSAMTKYCNYPARRMGSVDRLVLLSEGKEAWDVRLDLIEAARTSVDVVMAYIYLDRYGWMFCEALAAASRRGVAVRVIIDAFGAESFAFGGENPHSRCRRDGQAVVFDDLLLLLKGSGVAVGYWYGYSSVNGKEYPTKNHTKAIVTDSKYAVIGDRNIGIEYFEEWAGADFLLEGDAALAIEASINMETMTYVEWQTEASMATPEALRRREGTSPDIASQAEARLRAFNKKLEGRQCLNQGAALNAEVLIHIPQTSGYDPILHVLLEKIRQAKVSVDIRSCYIVLGSNLQKALENAVKRGVRVRILTNSAESCDLSFVINAQVTSLIGPCEGGVEVYMSEGDVSNMDHTKFLVIDSSWVCLGSWNCWLRTHFYEAEINVAIESPEAGEVLVRTEIDMFISDERIRSGLIRRYQARDLQEALVALKERGCVLDTFHEMLIVR